MKIPTYSFYQRGATLIVVLGILLVVTILGTLAIRQSITSLNIATNSQAQSLVLQNSDSTLYNIQDTNQLDAYAAGSGFIGYFKSPENRVKEAVFCYRGSASQFFDINTFSVISWQSGTAPKNNELGTDGYCNPSATGSTGDFATGRDAVLTQVSVRLTQSTQQAFDCVVPGTAQDPNVKLPPCDIYLFYAVSLIPGLAPKEVTRAQIFHCLSDRMSKPNIPEGVIPAADTFIIDPKADAADTVTDCLTRLNVPFSTQVGEYRYEAGF
jgi:hypothetical protein